MKKIMVLIASICMMLAFNAPANAALSWSSPWDKFDQVDCGSAPQTGHLSGNKGTGSDSDRFALQMEINDAGSGAPHNWNWKLYHKVDSGDWDLSLSGDSATGNWMRNTTAVNFTGKSDSFKFVNDSDSGVIHCVATINFG